jgi:hypothetical protein
LNGGQGNGTNGGNVNIAAGWGNTSGGSISLQAGSLTSKGKNSPFNIISLNASGGNVGIGTAAPQGALDVNGTICFSGANCISAWPSGGGLWNSSGNSIYNANSGNVGIGTASPGTQFDVAGNAQFGSGAFKSTFTAAGALNLAGGASINLAGTGGLCFNGSCQYAPAASGLWTSNGNSIYNGNSGNVGVGTANPAATFQVYNNTSIGTTPMLEVTGGTVSSPQLIMDALANGNVGVGTTSPQGTLDVHGTICLSGANCISSWPSGGGSWNSSGNNIYNANSGNVGIGTTSPSTALQVNGTVTATAFAGVGAVPSGMIAAFYLGAGTCPSGWLLANGSNGTPDLRGMFVRGAGTNGSYTNSNGAAYAATYGAEQTDQMQGHKHNFLDTISQAAESRSNTVGSTANLSAGGSANLNSVYIDVPISDGTNGTPRTGAETRPANYALTYCMKQ